MKRLQAVVLVVIAIGLARSPVQAEPVGSGGGQDRSRPEAFTVLGAVAMPGSYEVGTNRTILQLIARAGGFTSDAGRDVILFRQTAEGAVFPTRIPVADLLGDRSGLNALVDRDIVVVPFAGQSVSEAGRVVERDLKLRIMEGMKEGVPPAPVAVTSSFLRFTFSANLPAPAEFADEQAKIKTIFNLKDVRLITEADLSWKIGMPDKLAYTFRLNGREYTVKVKSPGPAPGQELGAGQKYGIEVFEKNVATAGKAAGAAPVSLLDTEFSFPSAKDAAVFGFEDTQGKPYFVSLQQTNIVAEEGSGVKGGGPEGRGSKAQVTPPKIVKYVAPVYPQEAWKANVEGSVILEATIDTAGRVTSVKVMKGVPLLNEAAIDAVKQWVYEPMIIGGKPRPAVFSVTARFRLDENKKGVVGGVAGGVAGGLAEKERLEFEKGAVRASDKINPPKLLKVVDPIYPPDARKAHVEGVVILEVRTDEQGNVEDVRVLRSIPVLDQAAIDAVKQWKYEPLIVDGKPRKVVFTVTVNFTLKEGEREKDFEEFARGAVRCEGDIAPPEAVKIVDPVYPPEARADRVEGVVILSVRTDALGKVEGALILSVRIDNQGKVANAPVQRAIPQLEQAALDAVKQWVYEPLIVNGSPMPAVFTVTVRYRLH